MPPMIASPPNTSRRAVIETTSRRAAIVVLLCTGKLCGAASKMLSRSCAEQTRRITLSHETIMRLLAAHRGLGVDVCRGDLRQLHVGSLFLIQRVLKQAGGFLVSNLRSKGPRTSIARDL